MLTIATLASLATRQTRKITVDRVAVAHLRVNMEQSSLVEGARNDDAH